MPHPSELARIEAENYILDPSTTAKAVFALLRPDVQKALRELIRQEDKDAYAVKLRAASARRRELNA